MNERLRILKLLEEGKINAEETARLLEALAQSETKERRGHFWTHLESIPDMVHSAVASSLKYVHTDEKLEIPKKTKIEFKGISGDIEIIGTDTETIKIEKDGFAKISEEGDKLKIKAISGDIKITAPTKIDLEIKGISGNLDIKKIEGKIDLSSVSGDIIGRELNGSFTGEIVSGDLDLDYENIEHIKIKSKSGDVTLRLSEKTAAEIEVETEEGTINCDFQLKDEIKKTNYLKGILNEPEAKIEIKNGYGDVTLKKRG